MSSDPDVFAEALERAPEERAAFLLERCANADQRARIEALLRGHEKRAIILAVPLNMRPADPPAETGSTIGRYKLLEKVGEGGCGVVWMAEQTDPVRRLVALKVIKLGMDTKEVIARFEAERQALALMEHPNIARVLDAGATELGRPYFVMELVRGQPITRYCDERNLTTAQRLTLFAQVCRAIHHAHEKGVVHRDIKPTNILVTNADGALLPKVIDFGIAKATQGRLTDRTLFTAFDQFIGTPAYMSPEQADYSAHEIDARSDVYSLGALLYELLSGRPPFDPKTLSSHGIEEVRRIIREVDPPRPSTRLSTLTAAERTTLAQHFGTSSAIHAGLLAGDLDWIAMKAIEKDRLRRYDSADALAADIERFLNHKPVSARPPATSYVLGKVIRRHRVAFAGAAVALFVLVAGAAVSTWQAIRATRAEHAERQLRQEKEARYVEDARLAEERRRAAALLGSRTDLALASSLLEDGKIGDALAYFLRAAQQDPSNSLLAPRLLDTLASRSFLLPDRAPLPLPARAGGFVHLTADGARLLFTGADGRVRIVSLADWKLEREVRFDSNVIFGSGLALAAANPSLFAVECGDGSIRVCDMGTGQPISPPVRRPSGLLPNTSSGSRISLSPDGRYLTSGDRKTAYVWDTTDGKLVLTLPFVVTNALSTFPISAGNRYVVSVPSDNVIALHSPANGTELHRISLEDGRYFGGCVFSPDGDKLVIALRTRSATSAPFSVRLYDLARKEWIGEEIKLADIRRVHFSRDSRRCVVAAREGELLIVDSATGRPLARPPRHNARVHDEDFSADGQTLLTSSTDGILRIWDVETGRLRMESTLPQERVIPAVLTPDARNVILFSSEPARIYHLQMGRAASEPLILPRSNRTVAQAAFLAAPPARLLWMMPDRAKIIDVVSGAELGGFAYPQELRPPTLKVQGLPESEIVSAGQRVLARTRDNRWHAWSIGETGISHDAVLQVTAAQLLRTTLSPDGSLVAVSAVNGSPRYIDVLNTNTGERVQRIDQTQPIQTPKAISADNRFVAIETQDSRAHLYELATGKDVVLLSAIRTTLRPDGSRIYTTSADHGLVTVRDATGKLLRSTLTHRDQVMGFSVTPDGKYFASYSNAGSVQVCDGSTGEPVGPKLLHPRPVRFVRFSPDGTRLLVALTDGTGRVWDIRTGQPLTDVLRHGSENSDGGFSADGRFVMLRGAASGPARIWSLPPENLGQPVPAWLLKIAAACAGRRLNDNGEIVRAEDAFVNIEELRRELAALSDDAPYVAWGRWLLSDPAAQSIAPGFTITPADSRKLRAAYAAVAGVPVDEPMADDDPPDASEPPGGKE